MKIITEYKYIDNLRSEDINQIGGKSYGIAKLKKLKEIKLPPDFTVNRYLFEELTKSNKNEILKTDNLIDAYIAGNIISNQNGQTSKNTLINQIKSNLILIQKKIEKRQFPTAFKKELMLAIKEYDLDFPLVARSSATAEDLSDASFAGQYESFLNISNMRNLLKDIKKCINSLFSFRAVQYLMNKRQDLISKRLKGKNPSKSIVLAYLSRESTYKLTSIKMNVLIQSMVKSVVSGVVFTVHPGDGRKGIFIEASYGYGEAVVSGIVSPDTYFYQEGKNGELIEIERELGEKETMVLYDKNGNVKKVKTPAAFRNKFCLRKAHLRELCKSVILIRDSGLFEDKFLDIEFSFDNKDLYTLQTRIETVRSLGRKKTIMGILPCTAREAPQIFEGGKNNGIDGANSGIVAVAFTREEAEAKIDEPNKYYLVTRKTHPEWNPILRRCKGVIVDLGGLTSHTAIVTRENNQLCLLDTKDATVELLKYDSQEITLDTLNQVLFLGELETTKGVREGFLREDIDRKEHSSNRFFHLLLDGARYIGKPEYALPQYQLELYKEAWDYVIRNIFKDDKILAEIFEYIVKNNIIFIQEGHLEMIQKRLFVMGSSNLGILEQMLSNRKEALLDFISLTSRMNDSSSKWLEEFNEKYVKLIAFFHIRWMFSEVCERIYFEKLNELGIHNDQILEIERVLRRNWDTETSKMEQEYRELLSLRAQRKNIDNYIISHAQNFKYQSDDLRLGPPIRKIQDLLEKDSNDELVEIPKIEEFLEISGDDDSSIDWEGELKALLSSMLNSNKEVQELLRIIKIRREQTIQKEDEHHIQQRYQYIIREKFFLELGELLVEKNIITEPLKVFDLTPLKLYNFARLLERDLIEECKKNWRIAVQKGKIINLKIENGKIKQIDHEMKKVGKYVKHLSFKRGTRQGAYSKLAPHIAETCKFCSRDSPLMNEIILENMPLINSTIYGHVNMYALSSKFHLLILPVEEVENKKYFERVHPSKKLWYQKREQKIEIRDIEDMYLLSCILGKEMVLFFNSVGAAASINHIHFQSIAIDGEFLFDKLSFKEYFLKNNPLTPIKFAEDYPALVIRFNRDELNHFFNLVRILTKKKEAFNIIMKDGLAYLIPRRKSNEITSIFKIKIGAYEIMGNIILTEKKDYINATETMIDAALAETSMSLEELEKILNEKS